MNAQCSLREVYTVHVNSRNAAAPRSPANFVAQLDIPLRNVIKAELLMASIYPATPAYPLVHVYVDELVSKFTTLAGVSTTISSGSMSSNIGSSTGAYSSNVGYLKNSFAVLPYDTGAERAGYGRILYNKLSSFPTECSYINPIRQLSRLTISLWNPDGTVPATADPNGDSYFTFRFECSKDNVCLY